jgi:hypothetical protein
MDRWTKNITISYFNEINILPVDILYENGNIFVLDF